ncbi:MAG: TonB-dependent receptor domain-containing protein [Bryobacteraceae bacterium]
MRFLLLLLGLVPAVADDGRPAPKPAPAPAPRANLSRASSLRNENVQANRIDNDALKVNNIRLGDNVTIVPQPPVEANYYATEHGRPAGEAAVLRPASSAAGWHGELFESLQNSVFNARTFFQVGPVQPSRQNQYGLRFTGGVGPLGSLTGSFTGRKTRGMVNGNVLVPLGSERTPTAADPAVRAIVERLLGAYPNLLPNRPDFDQRALNTNAPQRIDELDSSLRLERNTPARSRLILSHTLGRQAIQAFELVAGQNPDTEIHTHRSRATWRLQASDALEAAFGGGFTRVMSDLRPEPNAVGPRVRTGYQVEELGPDSQFPIHRAVNSFRGGVVVTQRAGAGSHAMTYGGDLLRLQLNGSETSNGRGVIWFSNNFGRTAIENMRFGTPTMYEVMLGSLSRGFRNWNASLYWADQWKLSGRLQIYYGMRYNLDTAPVEVHGLDHVPYGCDCNNFSPRFSLAWKAPREWMLRAGYTVSFAQIPPVTYGQVRYNLPGARYIQVQNPNILNPLAGVDLEGPRGRTSPTFFSPDLVSPYVHQYNLSLERKLAGAWMLRLGYVGGRGFKMLDGFIENRGIPVAGIPLTTATVDQRRADSRYYDVKYIVNSGASYLDAGQATLEAPYTHGLVWGATYTFGKALDGGADYSGTAANNDLVKGRSQSQFDAIQDKKALSNFDSTHSLLVYYSYELPWRGRMLRGIQISGSLLTKSGTPLTLYVGSDAPGFGNVDGGPGDRPNILDPSILGRTVGDPDTAPQIIRRDRFAYVRVGENRGNLGRNTFRKGGIANFNAAVSRSWRFGGRGERTLVLRGEAFNLTNHPQFDEPQRNLSSPAFGKITNTLNDGRVLQFGLRLIL